MSNAENVVSITARFNKDDASKAVQFPAAGDPRFMGSNIARDILKRASEFPGFAAVLFEYVSNAHESYQVSDFGREVHISVKKGHKGRVEIKDTGCGMSYATLGDFWKMHGETKRRLDGLNLRGYNGTGKIAGFKYFNDLTLSTVKDGLRNTTRLKRNHIKEMADAELPVRIDEIAINEETTSANGTVVTLSISQGEIKNSDILELRRKIAMEQMMWMRDTKFFLNDELVEPEAVTWDEGQNVVAESDCGSFKIDIKYQDRGYKDELPAVYISADRVFIARENYGKEGHRFSSKVHASVTTTTEWYQTYFEGQRENFVSESRDLKLKLTHPEAQKMKAFIETEVRAFMKKLDDEEKERQQKQLDERKKELQDKLSKLFSNMLDKLSFKRRLETEIVARDIPVERKKNENPREKKPKLFFSLREFENDDSDYRIDIEHGSIEVNMKSPQLRNVVESKDDATWDQAVLEIAKTAFVQMEATRRMQEAMVDRVINVTEFASEFGETSRLLRIDVNLMLQEMYRGFQLKRLSDIVA